jgi:hypothetical protein
MWKKILELFIRRVVWPLVQMTLEHVLVQLTQWILEKLREMMRKWQREEEATATSREQRDDVSKKYTQREADLGRLEQEIPDKIREIVRDAMREADKETPRLISASGNVPIAVGKKRVKTGRWRGRKKG